jgi:Zn finger protein HypA/HybF involved in hydrogenase expression
MSSDCEVCGTGVDSPEELEGMILGDCPRCESEDIEMVDGEKTCEDCGHTF